MLRIKNETFFSGPRTPSFPLFTPGTGAKMNDAICQSYSAFNDVMKSHNMSKGKHALLHNNNPDRFIINCDIENRF